MGGQPFSSLDPSPTGRLKNKKPFTRNAQNKIHIENTKKRVRQIERDILIESRRRAISVDRHEFRIGDKKKKKNRKSILNVRRAELGRLTVIRILVSRCSCRVTSTQKLASVVVSRRLTRVGGTRSRRRRRRCCTHRPKNRPGRNFSTQRRNITAH